MQNKDLKIIKWIAEVEIVGGALGSILFLPSFAYIVLDLLQSLVSGRFGAGFFLRILYNDFFVYFSCPFYVNFWQRLKGIK